MHNQAYERFTSSRQEPIRLGIALDEFFSPELDAAIRECYATYLQKRLGPAITELVLREDLTALEALRSMGWLDAHRADDAIVQARRQKRTAALIWLLQIKQSDFGYHDKSFPL